MKGATVNPAEEELLRRAIELAATARKSGNPPFGSLLAGPDGTVIAGSSADFGKFIAAEVEKIVLGERSADEVYDAELALSTEQ